MDLYSYANGDPVNFLDPTGRLFNSSRFIDDQGEFISDYGKPESILEFGEMMTDLFMAVVETHTDILPDRVGDAANDLMVEGFTEVSNGNILSGSMKSGFAGWLGVSNEFYSAPGRTFSGFANTAGTSLAIANINLQDPLRIGEGLFGWAPVTLSESRAAERGSRKGSGIEFKH